MTLHRPQWVVLNGSSVGTQPVDARLALAGLIQGDITSPLGARNGVFYDGQGSLVTGTSATSPMTYSIRAAQFCSYPTGVPAGGAAIYTNDGAVTVNTTAAPGSNSRWDVIWVRPQLMAADGGADSDNIPIFGVTQGTAAASPTVPAIPTGAVALAQALILSTTTQTSTAAFTQTHNWVTTHGSPIVLRNSTEQGALTTWDGLRGYRIDTHRHVTHNGTAFLQDQNPLPLAGNLHKPRRILKRTTAPVGFADSTLTQVGGWTADTGDDGDGLGFTLSGGNLLTIAKGGLFRVSLAIFFAASATGSRQASVWKNGVSSGTQVMLNQLPGSSAAGISVIVNGEVVCADGDTLAVAVQQTSGGALNVGSTGAGVCYWHVVRDDD